MIDSSGEYITAENYTSSSTIAADLAAGKLTKVLSSETKESILQKLGFTPYDAANPAGYQTANQVTQFVSNRVPVIIFATYATRPVAGVLNRLCVLTDADAIYYDTGTSWILVSGEVVQRIVGTVGVFSGTTTIPITAAPTASTGTQILTQSITLDTPGSKVMINVPLMFDVSANNRSLVLALFRGTTCLNVITANSATNGNPTEINLEYTDSPGAVGTYTYTCRVGLNTSGTWYVNKDKSGNTFGGKSSSQFSLTELVS